MAAGKKTGGRKRGTPNKDSISAEALARKLGVDPLEVLLNVAKADWEALGYKKPTQTKYSQFGQPFEVELITLQMRMYAAGQAVEYLRPKRKAIEHTGADGESLNKAPVVIYEANWGGVPNENKEDKGN